MQPCGQVLEFSGVEKGFNSSKVQQTILDLRF